MSVRTVSGVMSGYFRASNGNQEIESLNREKERLKQEISEIRTNSFMTGSEKRMRMQTLSTKISTISGRIQSLAKTQKCEVPQEIDEKADEKEKLRNKQLELQKELSEVRNSKNMDQQEKNTAVMKLMMEINTIANEMRSIITQEVNEMQAAVEITDTSDDGSKQSEEKVNLFIGIDNENDKKENSADKIDVFV